jgi:protein-tyrosine phosphatase
MKYAFVFGLLGVLFVGLAATWRGPTWLLVWPAISFCLVAAAYGGLGARVLGKRPDGRLSGWARLALLPYLLLSWLVWYLQCTLAREDCCNEVAPGLWLGRRAVARELPRGIDLVVDLTAEFAEPRGVARGRTYWCLPVLDACAPAAPALHDLVRKLAAWPGDVYVHCAMGHGRSALVVASVLLARGLAKDAAQAEEVVRRVRPGVRLGPAQRRLLAELASAANPDAASSI